MTAHITAAAAREVSQLHHPIDTSLGIRACAHCSDPIAEGDRITLTDTGWAHQHCHQHPAERAPSVCPDCHEQRALSGACSCPE